MADADVKWTVVVNDLPRIRKDMVARAEAILTKTAMDLEAGMKRRAPVDTGNLRNSIRAVRINSQHWRVEVGAEYGWYVEAGTVRNAPQPFFTPTVRAVIPEFRKAWEGIVS